MNSIPEHLLQAIKDPAVRKSLESIVLQNNESEQRIVSRITALEGGGGSAGEREGAPIELPRRRVIRRVDERNVQPPPPHHPRPPGRLRED